MPPRTPEAAEDFFSSLPEVAEFESVLDRSCYVDAPQSWYVVITDVVGSTRAIEQGRYREVNALGVASIIAVKNALPDLQLPFVFGGDGATLLVPGSRLQEVECALRGLRTQTQSSFDLGLRIARVSVAELRRAGHPVRVQRYRLSANVALGMFSGVGISMAEQWVKDPELGANYAVPDGPAQADLDGFECRWQPMPSQRGVVFCMIVVALGAEAVQPATYAGVLAKLRALVGAGHSAPVSLPAMRLRTFRDDYSIEARLVGGDVGSPEYAAAERRARKQTAIARALGVIGATAGGYNSAAYRQEFLQNSDSRKFDAALRMVLDLSRDEAAALEIWLLQQHERGMLVYGSHRSDAALATCMVKAYRGDHVHFIDGSDGGYALAAKGLKAQLAGLAAKT